MLWQSFRLGIWQLIRWHLLLVGQRLATCLIDRMAWGLSQMTVRTADALFLSSPPLRRCELGDISETHWLEFRPCRSRIRGTPLPGVASTSCVSGKSPQARLSIYMFPELFGWKHEKREGPREEMASD